ncbi:phospholipase D family protein [Thermodesulfobacteriota bacterium]
MKFSAISGKRKSRSSCLFNRVLLIFLIFSVTACTTLQKDFPRQESYALLPGTSGTLADAGEKIRANLNESQSGFMMLDRNEPALRWRLALIDLAEQTLDIQYFIWHGDEVGILLLTRLLRAADRGVRVRLLVDDILIQKGDRTIAALSAHPNFEIRVFNPVKTRTSSAIFRGLEFVFHLKRLNHRMHNKLFVADNRFAIVGGRNIGNEYFGLSKKFNFSDLEVLAAGPIARQISRSFDIYWNSKWAFPGQGLAPEASSEKHLEKLRQYIEKWLADKKHQDLLSTFSMTPRPWTKELNHFIANRHPGTGTVVYDKPLIGLSVPPVQLVESMADLAEDAVDEILISSPYFIPDAGFLSGLEEFRQKGVRIKILTNSLASTNHAIVHSAFRKYRRAVVEKGGELYEFREDAGIKPLYDTPPVESKYMGLHSKVFVYDRHMVFVGSLNLDPRSIYINTEMGLLIDSFGLAADISAVIDRDLEPDNSWKVHLDDQGKLSWVSGAGTIYKEPARNSWQRFQAGFFGLLPIEDQL